MNIILLFFICATWTILMGCIIDRLYNACINETRKQFRLRLFMSCCIMVIITCMYAWVIVRLSSSQEHPHEELILPPASDQLIGSAWFLNQTIVDV